MAGTDGIDAFLAFGRPIKGAPKIEGETGDVIEAKEVDGLGRSLQIKSYGTSFALETTNTEETHSQSGDVVAPEFKPENVVVRKLVDSATPALLKALRLAGRYEVVLISQRKAGGERDKSGSYFWFLWLYNVMVSNLQWETDESGSQTETVTLTYYDGLHVQYYSQKASGGLQPSPSEYVLEVKTAVKAKNGKDDKGAMSASETRSVVDQVVQRLKKANPSLHLKG